MSNEASSWALRQKAGGQGPKFLLYVLANHADKAGVCYPGRELLADECECRKETVSANMAKIESAGLIRRFERRRRNGSRTSDWIVLAPGGIERGEMVRPTNADYPSQIVDACKSQGGGIHYQAENTGEENTPGQVRKTGRPDPSGEPSGTVNGRATRLKVGGKPVNLDVWDRTVEALLEFNRQTGKDLSSVDSRGQPSESAKRIYGRLIAHQGLDSAAIADVIRRTLASRWWGDDAPSIGVVFGPAVFEENVGRDPSPKRSKDEALRDSLAAFVSRTDPAEDTDVVEGEAEELVEEPA